MKGTSCLSNTVLFFSAMRGVRDNPRIFTFLDLFDSSIEFYPSLLHSGRGGFKKMV